MLKVELELNGLGCTTPLAWFGKDYQKKELKSNDYLKLFGALACICDNNQDLLQEYGYTMDDIVSGSAISDGELYLNGFEGYDISERLNIKSLYLNQYDCVIVSVYDRKFNRFIDFVS